MADKVFNFKFVTTEDQKFIREMVELFKEHGPHDGEEMLELIDKYNTGDNNEIC